MKLLVTGGAGFIGSNFIGYWLKKYPQDSIINLDKLTYAGHLTSTKEYQNNRRYRFVKGDICNTKLVNTVMDGIDYVVHFAAESHVDRSIKDPTTFLKTNILGTQVLLDAALRAKIRRFHHISTDEVFGALELNDKKLFNEKTPYNPHSPYSASKAAADHLVRAYHDTFNSDITITNCSNNFGPFQDPEKFIPRMITNLLTGQKIKIYGDGKYVRDWLYVEDHCRAIDMVLNKAKSGDTYCVGGQTKQLNNFEIANIILDILNMDHTHIEFVTDRLGHDRRYAVDWSKIKKDFGWKPRYDFTSALTSTVKWYQDNKWWWQPLKAKSEKIYK